MKRASYRLVGARPKDRPTQPLDASFPHGTARAALTVSASDRTLGRRAWRLTPDKDERERHGCRPTNNSAAFVAGGDATLYPQRFRPNTRNGK